MLKTLFKQSSLRVNNIYKPNINIRISFSKIMETELIQINQNIEQNTNNTSFVSTID